MTEPNLSEFLSLFESAAKQLNQASDSLNEILSAIEKRLVAANAGVEAWSDNALTSSDAEGSTRGETAWIEQRLGFTKVNGKWCLAVKGLRVVSGFFEGDTSMPYQNTYIVGEPWPLLNATRDLRIAALRDLPRVVSALADQATMALTTIEDAAQRVKQS